MRISGRCVGRESGAFPLHASLLLSGDLCSHASSSGPLHDSSSPPPACTTWFRAPGKRQLAQLSQSRGRRFYAIYKQQNPQLLGKSLTQAGVVTIIHLPTARQVEKVGKDTGISSHLRKLTQNGRLPRPRAVLQQNSVANTRHFKRKATHWRGCCWIWRKWWQSATPLSWFYSVAGREGLCPEQSAGQEGRWRWREAALCD